MNRNSFVAGGVIGALAVFLIWLLSGGWGGMMGPGWNYGMMGPWMMTGWMGFNPLGWLIFLGVFLAALVLWAANSGKKQ